MERLYSRWDVDADAPVEGPELETRVHFGLRVSQSRTLRNVDPHDYFEIQPRTHPDDLQRQSA